MIPVSAQHTRTRATEAALDATTLALDSRGLTVHACSLVLGCASVRLVGKGSFGSVYLVSRRRDGAQFVLKNMQIKNVPEKEIEVRDGQAQQQLTSGEARGGSSTSMERASHGALTQVCLSLPLCALLSHTRTKCVC